MKTVFHREEIHSPPIRCTGYAATLDPSYTQRPSRQSEQEPSWWKEAVKAMAAAAHRAEQAKAREERRYGGPPAFLPPHPVLLNEAWAVEQLRALPDGKPQRTSTAPRLQWTGSGGPPRRMERDGNARRFAGKMCF